MKIFYFTSTGNSLDLAKRFGGEIYSIPKLLKKNEFSFQDEKIGFVIPCYFWGIPRPVTEFIKKAALKADYFFAVITCGNITGPANVILQKTAGKSGFSFDYINDIKMVDNYIPMFEVNKELELEPGKNIDLAFDEIKKDIEKNRKMIVYKGFFVKLIGMIAQAIYRSQLKKPDNSLYTSDVCNKCGICVSVCPVENIRVETLPVFGHNCELCFACLHNCPQGAIHHKKEKSTARFRNRNVKLSEIVESNS